MKKTKPRPEFLITKDNTRSVIAEAYRILRTNMGFTELDRPCRTILMTSPNPTEGKSTTAANLAVVMAQAGHRVLLIDCDLRKPVQHRFFNLSNQYGLTNCLREKTIIPQAIHKTEEENLFVMPSGPVPPNPSEVLSARHTQGFWNTLKEQYDYIIIDAPPVLVVTDATILATQLDGVLLVVNSGETRIDHAREAKEQLTKGNAHIIGVVLNQVKKMDMEYNYYYYSQDVS